jgi:hypothetical protein
VAKGTTLKWPGKVDAGVTLLGHLANGAVDRNYTAMRTHVQWSVHLSALLVTWFTWGDGLQRGYASDVAFCIIRFTLTVDNSDMN